MRIFRWMKETIEALEFLFLALKKDKEGKVRGILYTPDDLKLPDFYPEGDPFSQRVFISFERQSVKLAEKFEVALRAVGLEPYRYEPAEPLPCVQGKPTLKQFRSQHPEIARQMLTTVRRSAAVLIIVSKESQRSPFCEAEAYFAAFVHSFWPDHRVRNEAAVYIILAEEGLSVPSLLSKFWSRVYTDGLELAVADLIALEIERNAAILRDIELHRRRVCE